jgi:hypothetical protein
MKTQIVLGAYDSVFFPVPPAKLAKSGHVDGGSPYFPRVPSAPNAAGRISARTPARRDNSGLPASLKDWLVCKEALEICQKNCDLPEDNGDVWVATAKPLTRGKNLPAAIARP